MTMPNMATPNAAEDKGSEADVDQRNVFPFFRLARELRDAIYDECMQEIEVPSSRREPEVHAAGVLRPNLLRVNHQFAAEYSYRTQTCGILTVSDRWYSLGQAPFIPPLLCQRPLFIEFNIWCPWEELVDGHWDSVMRLLAKIATPRGFAVRIIGSLRTSVDELLKELNLMPWTTIPNFTSLQVYWNCNTDAPRPSMWRRLSDMKHVGQWSKSSGKIEDIRGMKRLIESEETHA